MVEPHNFAWSDVDVETAPVAFLPTRGNGDPAKLFIRQPGDERWEIVEGEAAVDDGEVGTSDPTEAERILDRVLSPEVLR